MGYLIDTCIFIDLLMGKLSEPARKWLTAHAAAGLTKTSVVVYHELLFGAATPKAQKAVGELLGGWEILPVDAKTAAEAASIRRKQRAAGKILGMADSLIAATVKLHNLKLVTADLKGFPEIETVNLRDLR
ncbi:MAG: type II toxin-antitoxin system VapC family toxin [Thermoanaerobacteraceae bacterium]|nr:type II toxin-antitoxin system VapC family toxin [Thermoanaerobacteraceae bacterium]